MKTNKSAILFLSVTLLLLCLYYLSFTFIAKGVEQEAIAYANKNETPTNPALRLKQDYLDSVMNKVVFSLGLDYTYKEVKDLELKLGLDLQGGMHVTMEVSPSDLIIALSANNKEASFRQALKDAQKNQASASGNVKFTKLFYDAYKKLAPNGKLIALFSNSANRNKIKPNATDEEILAVIDQELEDAYDRSYNILKNRIDKFGVTQPSIQRIPGTGRIQVELPGVDNPKRVRKLLQGAAVLEFWEVATFQEVQPIVDQINRQLINKKKAGVLNDNNDSNDQQLLDDKKDDQLLDGADTLDKKEDIELTEKDTAKNDLTDKNDSAAFDAMKDSLANAEVSEFLSLIQQSYRTLAYRAEDTSRINRILAMPDVASLIPSKIKFLWGAAPIQRNDNVIELYAVKVGRNGQALLEGDVIEDARYQLTQNNRPGVSMKMVPQGAREWAKITRKNVGRQVAIVLDNVVYSAPVINEEISGGSSSISGNFTVEEAKDLANILKSGKLPAPTRIIEETVVGATLGAEVQSQGILAAVIGLSLVMFFMIFYYAKAGVVSVVALLFNILFILGVLAQLGASLTLPGIAGIVLTMGMSIDANVLIFERVREELAAGKPTVEAIEAGYSRAFWTIFDSNVTTFITALTLFVYGSGPIQGFATTLMIGIICSFFTAVYISKLIVAYMVDAQIKKIAKAGGKGEVKISFSTPMAGKFFANPNFNFIKKRKVAYGISAFIIAAGIALIAAKGLNFGVDFQGGRSYVVKFNKDLVPSDLQSALKTKLDNKGVEVKTFGDAKSLKITTNYLIKDESLEADSVTQKLVLDGIEAFAQVKFEVNDAKLADGNFVLLRTNKVGATIADDIRDSALFSIIFSLVALFGYIFLRFRRWQFGFGAVMALLHDSLIVFAMYSFAWVLGLPLEVDQVFVAALLTIIGYSINDTVVVFDRIRETITPDANKEQRKLMMNKALNDTLSRTVITGVTTLFVVLVLLIFGGESLRGFSYTLLVGIIFGTYSSIYVASNLVLDTWKDKAPATPSPTDEKVKA